MSFFCYKNYNQSKDILKFGELETFIAPISQHPEKEREDPRNLKTLEYTELAALSREVCLSM
jgi:hypothetical protein